MAALARELPLAALALIDLLLLGGLIWLLILDRQCWLDEGAGEEPPEPTPPQEEAGATEAPIPLAEPVLSTLPSDWQTRATYTAALVIPVVAATTIIIFRIVRGSARKRLRAEDDDTLGDRTVILEDVPRSAPPGAGAPAGEASTLKPARRGRAGGWLCCGARPRPGPEPGEPLGPPDGAPPAHADDAEVILVEEHQEVGHLDDDPSTAGRLRAGCAEVRARLTPRAVLGGAAFALAACAVMLGATAVAQCTAQDGGR